MISGGAPYSAIGVTELSLFRSLIGLKPHSQLDPIPIDLNKYHFWQHGSGRHSSAKRRILGSTLLQFKSDKGMIFLNRHLVLDCSSQWLLGLNVTLACNHLHINEHRLQFPVSPYGNQDNLSIFIKQPTTMFYL